MFSSHWRLFVSDRVDRVSFTAGYGPCCLGIDFSENDRGVDGYNFYKVHYAHDLQELCQIANYTLQSDTLLILQTRHAAFFCEAKTEHTATYDPIAFVDLVLIDWEITR
jgi:hypothetical protein